MSDVRTLLAVSKKYLPKHCFERVCSELSKGNTEQMRFYILGVIEKRWSDQNMTLDEYGDAFSQLGITAKDYSHLEKKEN